jgi:hypothetical protein
MSTPAQDGHGPSFDPPHLPAGWIAQWDAAGGKYYFVQLATGQSQWEVPTEAAAGTPHGYASPSPEGQGKVEDGPTGDRGGLGVRCPHCMVPVKVAMQG